MNRLELYAHQINSDKKLEKIQISVCPKTNIGFITLNSPKDLNSLSQVMGNQLSWALHNHNQNPQVNVIVIKSKLPKIFCAGADIKRFTKGDYEYFTRNQIFNIFQQSFKKVKKPIIAAVNGKALGGGFQLALLTDVIVASQKAYFALPQVTLGLIPGIGGTQRLSKIIGQKMAMRYILTAQGFDGKKANQLNISQLVQSQNFDENIVNFTKKISQKAVTTMIVAKKSIKFSSQSNLAQGLQFQKSSFYPLVVSKAAVQGVSAFVEKRKANFKGM